MFKFRQKNSTNERRPESTPKARVYSYQNLSKREKNTSSSNNKLGSKITSKIHLTTHWFVVAGVITISSYLLYASNNPIIRIDASEVIISSESVYRESVIKNIKSNIFNKTKLTFDYLGFAKNMETAYPEISSVKTNFALIGSRPVIRLTFYKPVITVSSLGKNWAVDSRGVAISEYKDSMSNLPKLTDEIGIVVEEGGALVSSRDVTFISIISKAAKEKGINIDKYTTPLIPKQLDVRVVGESYYTKFNLNEDPIEQAGVWLSARENLSRIGQTPTEYLDVRASEKVYWK